GLYVKKMFVGNEISLTNQLHEPLVLHIIVIGFHHKRGYQVEYTYPQFPSNTELPKAWVNLPSLTLPDGAHNRDKVYFHLPSLTDAKKTVFGVACYRQINAKNIQNKDADVTRNSIQKSVCVLLTKPYYGLVSSKLEIVTHAYFNENDFTKTSILETVYETLNETVLLQDEQAPLIGLSVRDLVIHYRRKILLLFKLLLLQKKVLFLMTPVETLVKTMISLVSLMPDLVENNLDECTYIDSSLLPQLRPIISNTDSDDVVFETEQTITEEKNNQPLSATKQNDKLPLSHLTTESVQPAIPTKINDSQQLPFSPSENIAVKIHSTSSNLSDVSDEETNVTPFVQSKLKTLKGSSSDSASTDSMQQSPSSTSLNILKRANTLKAKFSSAINRMSLPLSNSTTTTDQKVGDTTTNEAAENTSDTFGSYTAKECGLPLQLFKRNHLFHPYLSINSLEQLYSPLVRGFIVGATNSLFKQRDKLDVTIEDDATKFDIRSPLLRQQLQLTTADLRFQEFILQNVLPQEQSQQQQQHIITEASWEGNDEWIRLQFKDYLISLLATVKSNDDDLMNDFNRSYVEAFRSTDAYKQWLNQEQKIFETIPAGHLFAGQLNVQDVKLRVSHALQDTEAGRKLKGAVVDTSQFVNDTSRAATKALQSAKTTMTTFVGSFTKNWFNKPTKTNETTDAVEEQGKIAE
ncbi:unnamed protein product, partial [Didymodactylos carnosus]